MRIVVRWEKCRGHVHAKLCMQNDGGGMDLVGRLELSWPQWVVLRGIFEIAGCEFVEEP